MRSSNMKWAPQHLVKEMTLGSKEVAWISLCCHQKKHSTYHAMILDSRLDDSTIILQNDMDWERHRPPCKQGYAVLHLLSEMEMCNDME